MDEPKQVAEGIYLIDAQMFFPGLASAYLVVGKTVALIETGLSISAPHIAKGVRDLGFQPGDISHIVVTHAHLDHAGSAGILLNEYPRARLAVHKIGAPHLIDPTRLLAGVRKSLGDEIADRYRLDLVVPVDAARVDAVEGGETIDLGGRSLKLIFTPGHCSYHISPYDSLTGGLFCGDMVGTYNEGYNLIYPTTPAPEFNLRVTIDTINQLKQMDIRMLLFSHFGASRDVLRLLEMSAEIHVRWGEVMLKAMREGDGVERAAQILLPYLKQCAPFMPDWLNAESAATFAKGYLTYFQRQGIS